MKSILEGNERVLIQNEKTVLPPARRRQNRLFILFGVGVGNKTLKTRPKPGTLRMVYSVRQQLLEMKGASMIDLDNLEDFRDPQTYDLEDEGYYDDWPLTERWARSLGGPLLDLACGTGRIALRMAAQGYQVTGVAITPEMIAWARQKAAKQGVSIEWVVADARTFHIPTQF